MGKTVLITGCSDGGLGAALALEFHKAGFKVLASARNLSKLSQVKAAGIETIQLDVLSDESIAACVTEVGKRLNGKLDILVNNAGAGYSMPVLDVKLDNVRKLFELNTYSLISMAKAFLPLLRAAPQGWIVNNTSIVSVLPVPIQASYNASKAAASSFTQALRLEVAPFNIKVIELRTGAVKSNFFNNVPAMGTEALPADSIYNPAKETIEEKMNGGDLMSTAMPSDQWAQGVVSDLSKANPPVFIWRGGQATQARLGLFFPMNFFDGMLSKMSGLETLAQKLRLSK